MDSTLVGVTHDFDQVNRLFMEHDVFISHAHKDKSIADAICEKLESARLRCWIPARDISAGEDWTEVTWNAISRFSTTGPAICRTIIGSIKLTPFAGGLASKCERFEPRRIPV